MPFTSPEPRYFSMPSAVLGRIGACSVNSNWRPCILLTVHIPRRRSASPGGAAGSVPTATTGSVCPSGTRRATV